jgi:proline dehydrogenase
MYFLNKRNKMIRDSLTSKSKTNFFIFQGFFTDSDQSERMDATNSTESPTQKKIRIEEEKTFWKRITAEELLSGKDEEEDKGAPSSSSKLSSKLDESTMPCSICLSDMREEQENADAIVQLTLCDHRFHEECIRVSPQ